MTVETPERAWTDPRLDDLSKKVDDGFAEVDAGFAKVDASFSEVRSEMKAGFEKADEKLDANTRELRSEMKAGFEKADAKLDAGFDKFDKKFDRLMWSLLGAAVLIIAHLLGLIEAIAHSHVL